MEARRNGECFQQRRLVKYTRRRGIDRTWCVWRRGWLQSLTFRYHGCQVIGGAEHVQEYTCHRKSLDSTPEINHFPEAVEVGLDFFWFADDALKGQFVHESLSSYQPR